MLLIPLVLSTNQIYHLAASRLGDKFKWPMTFGELLHNKTLLIIFFYFLKEYPRVFYTTLPFLSISSLALLSLILSYKKKNGLFHVRKSEDKSGYFIKLKNSKACHIIFDVHVLH